MVVELGGADWVLSFVQGAAAALNHELGAAPSLGPISETQEPLTSAGVSVLLSLTGELRGVVIYDMDEKTALTIAGTLAGTRLQEFDELAESAVAELGNVMTGRAGVEVERIGHPFSLSLPSVVRGQGSHLMVPETARRVVPVETPAGKMRILLALEQT